MSVVRCLSVLTVAGMAVFSLLPAKGAQAADKILVTGDCRDFSFVRAFGDRMSHASGLPVRVLRDEALVFSSATGNDVARNAAFSENVNVVEVVTEDEQPDERVGVKFIHDDDTNTYWMDRTDLHCQRQPLIDPETHLEQKALIRTKTTERKDGIVQAITAYRSPNIQEAVPDDSRKLSRFRTYLIYGESPDAYLLGDKFNLVHSEDKLVGWVEKKDVLNWNWAIGLRPDADLKNPDGSTGAICGYTSLESDADCVPVLGGNSWFKSSLRLPVLEVSDTYYRVAAAASGINAGLAEDGKIRLTKEMLDRLEINPSETVGIDEEKIRSFNQIDVFFLIDGTKSMGPFIDGIRGDATTPGVVRTIVKEIEERRNGASIRAGFRVFRDSKTDGQAGIDEAYALRNSNCDSETAEIRERERRRFERRLETIRTTSDDKDDFDENLLGGLEQAAEDMRGCPDRQKILFVISDAGYDPEKQASRGQRPLSPDDVARRLTGLDKVTVFFMRPPLRGPEGFKSRSSHESYVESWNEYLDYATAILTRVLSRDQNNDGGSLDAQDYIFNIDPGNRSIQSMLDKIVGSIKAVTRPEIVNDILIDLRGGAALEKVITRLQRENEDVPVLYWNMLRRTACEDNEEVCNQRIYDGVFDLYIPKSEKPVLEAWMRWDELSDWTSLLRDVSRAGLRSLPEEREAMGQTIRNSLSTVLRLPSPDNMNETIQEYMRRGGYLPGPVKTPLLNYTFNQLKDPALLPPCEIDRLKQWLDASHAMLEMVLRNELSSYELAEPRSCPKMSDNGRNLKLIKGQPTPVAPGPDSKVYLLGRENLGETIYWVPHEYLP
jgi:hypothetical protein